MDLIFFEGVFCIFITSIIYFLLGVTISKIINDNSSEYNKNTSKIKLFFEVAIQIGIIATSVYFIRLLVRNIISFLNSGKKLPGSPDKYAMIIVAPTMFSLQPKILEKIKHIWSFKFLEGDKNLEW